MAPRYLIVGGSGPVGKRLYEALGPGKAVATYCSRPVPGSVFFDVRSARLTDSILHNGAAFTHAFVLLGVTNLDQCARNPRETAEINVAGVCAVIDDLVARRVIPIFVSSDAVFDGTRGMWTENDAVNPVLTYGRQKAQVEHYLARIKSPWLVARLSKVVCMAGRPGDMLQDWIEKLESGTLIRCAHDQTFSPVLLDDAVNALIGLADGNFTGVFHVCGPRPVTRLEFLQMLVDHVAKWRPTKGRIVSCSLEELKDMLCWEEARPRDTSMSPRKLCQTVPLDLHEMAWVCEGVTARRYGREPETMSGSGGAGQS